MLVRIGLTRDTHFALPRSQATAADNPLQSARALRMPPGRLGLPAGSGLRRWLVDFRVRLLGEEDVGDVCLRIRRDFLEGGKRSPLQSKPPGKCPGRHPP